MYMNCSRHGVRSRTRTLAPCLHEEPLKKRVQWGSVKTRALGSDLLSFGPHEWNGGGVQSTMKSAST
jgi:hypothetical protein